MDKQYTAVTMFDRSSKKLYVGPGPDVPPYTPFFKQDVTDDAITAMAALRNHESDWSEQLNAVADEIRDAEGEISALAAYAVFTATLAPLFSLWDPKTTDEEEAWDWLVMGAGPIPVHEEFEELGRIVAAAVLLNAGMVGISPASNIGA